MEDDTEKGGEKKAPRAPCHELLVRGLRTAREQGLSGSVTTAVVYLSIAGTVDIPPKHRQKVYDEVVSTIDWVRKDWPEMVEAYEQVFEFILESFENYLGPEPSEKKDKKEG